LSEKKKSIQVNYDNQHTGAHRVRKVVPDGLRVTRTIESCGDFPPGGLEKGKSRHGGELEGRRER